MKDDIQIKLSGRLANFVTGLAEKCNCSPDTVVENILLYRLAERTAQQQVFPDEASSLPEFILQDGQLITTGDKVFAAILEMKTNEFEEIKKMREIIDGLMESSFRTMSGGNA